MIPIQFQVKHPQAKTGIIIVPLDYVNQDMILKFIRSQLPENFMDDKISISYRYEVQGRVLKNLGELTEEYKSYRGDKTICTDIVIYNELITPPTVEDMFCRFTIDDGKLQYVIRKNDVTDEMIQKIIKSSGQTVPYYKLIITGPNENLKGVVTLPFLRSCCSKEDLNVTIKSCCSFCQSGTGNKQQQSGTFK